MILKPIGGIAVFCLIFGLSACSPKKGGIRDTKPPATYKTPTPQASAAKETDETAFLVSSPQDPMSREEALRLSLLHNPTLKSFALEKNSRAAARLQAGLYANPELQTEFEDFGGTDTREGVDDAQTTVQLSQPLLLGRKRSKRVDVATLDQDQSHWEYEAQRLAISTQVGRAFIAVLNGQERLRLAEELEGLAKKVEAIVSERVNAGKVSPVETMKARILRVSTQIDLDQAKKVLQIAKRRLSAHWGDANPGFTRVAGTLKESVALPDIKRLSEQLSENPILAKWKTEIRRRRALLALEKAKALPDMRIAGGVRQFQRDDDHAFVVGFSMPFPIFDRNQGGISAARIQVEIAEEKYRAAEVEMQTALAESYDRLFSTHQQTRLLENDILPEAERALEAINEGYRLGRFKLLEVLDAQRTLFKVRIQHIQALTDYQYALVALEGLVGEPLARMKGAAK